MNKQDEVYIRFKMCIDKETLKLLDEYDVDTVKQVIQRDIDIAAGKLNESKGGK